MIFFSTCSSMHVNKPGIYLFFAYLVKYIFFSLSHDTFSCYCPIIYKQDPSRRFVSTCSCTHQNHSKCFGRSNSWEVGKMQLLNSTELISIEVEQMHKLSFGILIRGSKKMKVFLCFIFFPIYKYSYKIHCIRQGIIL